jgi:hypothetical protein
VPSNLRPFPKKVSDAGPEWVGGRFVMPFETEGVQPIAALWIALPEGLMLAADISHPQAIEGWFAKTLRDAIERAEGKLPRPSRVRVASQALADELRAAHGDIEVVVAPTPETDEAYASLLASMGASPPNYLEGDLPPALIEELFQAAERLYRLAPWKMGIEDVIRVDAPSLGIDSSVLAVMGQAKVDYGFLLFPSIEAYDRFGQIGESLAEGEEPESIGTSMLSLTFENKRVFSPSVLQTIKQYKWPVAGTNAYPLAQHRDENTLLLPFTESDARTLIAITNAFVPFCAMHRDVLSGERADEISESYTGDSNVTVRLTYPPEVYDLFEDDEPPEWESGTVRKAPLPGRNDPCHCGSGKKYKKCHLDKDHEETAGPDRIHALDMRLVDELALFGTSEFPGKWLPRDVTDLPPQLALHLVIQWAVYERPIAGRPLIEHYLDDQELDKEEEAWVSAQRAGWLTIWEVLSTVPGSEVVVRDLLTGQKRTVREQVASKTLRARDAVLARVVDHEGRSLFCGLYGRSLPPFAVDEVLSDARKKLRKKTGDIPVERLRGGKLGLWLLLRWADALDDLDEGRSVPPMLTNTDGDAIALVIDRFAFDRANRDAVEARLATIDGAVKPPPAGRETEIAFFKPDEFHNDIETATVIGFAFIADSVLRVETNSESRAAALRQAIEDACGDLIRHRSREQKDPRQMLADRKGPAKPAPEPTAEEQEFVREYKQRYYQKWLDEPIPALNGKTPRQAARSRAGREQLDLLLREMENAEQRLPEPERFDVSTLRTELGL